MSLLKRNTKKEKEVKTTGVETSATPAPIVDEKKEEVRRTKTIRKGAKVTITGRLYGTSTKDAPMGFATHCDLKVLEIDKEHGTVKTSEGWVDLSSVEK